MRRCRAVQGAYGPLRHFAAILPPLPPEDCNAGGLYAPPAGKTKSHFPQRPFAEIDPAAVISFPRISNYRQVVNWKKS